MQSYQFKCVDCGVLFEAMSDQKSSTFYCDFCGSQNVKKLFAVADPVMRDDEALLEDEC